MRLIIGDYVAAIKDNAAIDLIRENRFFTEAEDYTLEIELPLKELNKKIFGHLERKDIDKKKIYYKAQIISSNLHLYGACVITEVTQKSVKVQFIAGRSLFNYYPEWDDIYINELELGNFPIWRPEGIQQTSETGTDVMTARPRPTIDDEDYDENNAAVTYVTPGQTWLNGAFTCLPWVNNTSGNIQNVPQRDDSGNWKWKVEADDDDDTDYCTGLSFQIRLSDLVMRVIEAVGYTGDISAWAEHWTARYIYVMNALPAAWDNRLIAAPLPHWSIKEFFTQIENLLCCEFVVDHFNKKITFRWASIDMAKPIFIKEVIDEYQMTQSKDDDSGYIAAKNLQFSDGGHHLDKFYNCNWIFDSDVIGNIAPANIANINELVNDGIMPYGLKSLVFHTMNDNRYYALLAWQRVQVWHSIYGYVGVNDYHYDDVWKIVELNRFGTVVNDEEDEDNVKNLDIVPACIDSTDEVFGQLPFLDVPEQSDDSDTSRGRRPGVAETAEEDELIQYYPITMIQRGEQETKEYYSKLFIGMWNGDTQAYETGGVPHHITDNQIITTSYQIETQTISGRHSRALETRTSSGVSFYAKTNVQVKYVSGLGSLSLHATGNNDLGQRQAAMPKINSRQKYVFSFLTKQLPELNRVFVIHNKKYICGKITTTLGKGKVYKVKGEFFKLQ